MMKANKVKSNPKIPDEKLFTNISKPGLMCPSKTLSNRFKRIAAIGPTTIAPINIGISAPTTAPIVTTEAITPPRTL